MMEIYQNLSHAASFDGVNALCYAAKEKVPKKTIQKWLKGVDSYTLYKPVQRKLPNNHVIVYSIDR